MADRIQTKRCAKCKQIKQYSEFQKDKTKKDGLQSYCKSCQKDYDQSEKGKAVKKHYIRSKEGKAAHSRGSKKYQKTEKGKIIQQAITKRFNDRHPNQQKARDAVKYAVAAGRIPWPDSLQCHYCPAQAKQYHHYKGYKPEHWLEVVPVCIKCHHKNRRLSRNER